MGFFITHLPFYPSSSSVKWGSLNRNFSTPKQIDRNLSYLIKRKSCRSIILCLKSPSRMDYSFRGLNVGTLIRLVLKNKAPLLDLLPIKAL
jgi:hypothetical protein